MSFFHKIGSFFRRRVFGWRSSAEQRRFRKYRLGLLSAFVLFFFVLPLGFVIYVVADMPSLSTLENPKNNLSSLVYTSDGKVLGSYYVGENRVNVGLEDVPQNLRDALIATEDRRFYRHNGVDPTGLLSTIYRRIIGRGFSGGASTLTQQLARNLYDEAVGKERTVLRKAKEAIVSFYLERRYTKPEIMLAYLNTVPWGGEDYGVHQAAKRYFNKDVSNLEPQESALLVGILRGASYYDPVRHPERAKDRRNTVLALMANQDFIPRAQADSLMALELNIDRLYTGDHNAGLATYFREQLRGWLNDWCRRNNYSLTEDGLRIYTTINSKMQQYAEEAMAEHLAELQATFDKETRGRETWLKDDEIAQTAMTRSARYNMYKSAGYRPAQIEATFEEPQEMRVFAWNEQGYIDTTMTPMDSLKYYAKFLQPGMISIDPATGHILAWVGGINQRYFQYDHVQLGKRQVGSTFKPFVYTAAFDNGFSPCHQEYNTPVTIELPDGTLWSPRNADRSIGGEYTLRRGLATSTNIITAKVIKAIGPEVVTRYAANMGIETPIEAVPSIALGTIDLSVKELTSAYATFANRGRWIEPMFVTRIEDRNGNVIEEFVPDSREALSEETAYLMVDMLRAVVNEGTGIALRYSYNFPANIDIGGKTGTTQNHSDGWFVGITPYFATGVWVGHSDRRVHFPSIRNGQGAVMALPIWAKYMRKVYEDEELGIPRDFFEKPPGLQVQLDCSAYREEQGGPGDLEDRREGDEDMDVRDIGR